MEPSIKLKDSNCNVNALVTGTTTITSAGAAVGATTVAGTTATTQTAIAHICSSDSFSIIPPPHHELVSANSIELNAAASLSDDSGVPLTTNSSISSGDSYRIGMCKFEIELVESDGEVSQFDSLDNCSEGGMSAENFNTLKKGPLAPIDPPPEFQDSPQTTLVRSISKNIVNSLRRWTSSQSSFEHLKDYSSDTANVHEIPMLHQQNNTLTKATTMTTTTTAANAVSGVCSGIGIGIDMESKVTTDYDFYANTERSLKEAYAINKHLYSSDSILSSHTDNIYDEPNNIISTSLGNSVDIIESDDTTSSPLPSPPPPVSIIKIKQTLCPYYQDHTRYFKAIPSEQDNINKAAQRFNTSGLSEIHDYDLYYGAKRQQQQQQQQYDNSLQRRLLYSPLSHAHHCHYHHNHHHHHHHHSYTTAAAGVGVGVGNRPNSRNSLNSRLSSSHNSLNVSSTNKPDDSIFITQAMSHDALFTREISDFYNVPIDSDIYAFPVDMITAADKDCVTMAPLKSMTISRSMAKAGRRTTNDEQQQQQQQPPQQQQKLQQHVTKSNRRNNRNKRKKRYAGVACSTNETSDEQQQTCGKYRTPANVASSALHSENDAHTQEPLHMTLDEVKQFYHTLYSDATTTTKSTTATAASLRHAKSINNKLANGVKSSNETIWSISTTTTMTTARSRSNLGTTRSNTTDKQLCKQKHAQLLDNDKINNNNNNNNNTVGMLNQHNQSQTQTLSSNYQHHQQQQLNPATHQHLQTGMETLQMNANVNANSIGMGMPNNKQLLHTEKKSQFTLNLKQKFCSIFRFRRNHNRCRSSNTQQQQLQHNGSETEENCLNREQSAGMGIGTAAEDRRKKFQSRALPPLPKKAYAINKVELEQKGAEPEEKKPPEPRTLQFTSSIEKVKDYGWYWGPLSSEAAEKVLSNEPDGSFIVRDSSDDHYIFSLSFKLNNCVRHVRIEQDQGTFSFGSYAKFKSQTITEFIEKAVEHSRSGRYLFFLHRRPEHGPMRVQLTNPVSRFKHVQSLQHMCRFVILKAVIRKDLIQTLPLPRRLLDYLNYKHCYSEQVESDSSHSQISGDGSM